MHYITADSLTDLEAQVNAYILANPTFNIVGNFTFTGKFIQAVAEIGSTPSTDMLQFIKVSLTSLQIQTLSTIPVNSGVPLPGAGKYLRPIAADIKFIANTTPYTSATIAILIDTSSNFIIYNNNTLNGAVDNFQDFIQNGNPNDLLENKAMMITANSDSIGVGDGTADIFIYYAIGTL